MHSPRLPDSPLHEQDVRNIVRLLGEVIASPGDIRAKRRFLMDGLCELVNATSWAWCMAEFDPDKPPSFIGFEHGGWGEERFARYVEAMNHPDMEAVTRPSSIELKGKGTQLTRTLRQMDPPMRLENSAAGAYWAEADIGTLIRRTGQPEVFSIQYIRCKASANSGLTYTPEFCSDLTDNILTGWSAATGTETVQSIDSEWERVTITDTAPASAKRFGRVKVVSSQ